MFIMDGHDVNMTTLSLRSNDKLQKKERGEKAGFSIFSTQTDVSLLHVIHEPKLSKEPHNKDKTHDEDQNNPKDKKTEKKIKTSSVNPQGTNDIVISIPGETGF